MFTWKVEDMALRAERPYDQFLREYRFRADRETSREDKIAFVDSMTDGKLSYLLNLIERWKVDSVNMPKDSWDSVKTVSLIAWCKRNDTRSMIDRTYRYGKFRILSCERYISNADHKGPYDKFQDLVDEVFHEQLCECLNKENQYFEATDEYELAKTLLRENSRKYGTSFGVRLCFSSSGTICIPESDDSFKGPEITLEQCNMLNSLYKQLEATIADLTNVCEKNLAAMM